MPIISAVNVLSINSTTEDCDSSSSSFLPPRKKQKQKQKQDKKQKQKQKQTQDKKHIKVSVACAVDEDQLGMLYKVLELHVLKGETTLVVITDVQRFSPQHVANVLKQLNFQAVALHNKSPKAQRLENLQRFSIASHRFVLVSTPHAIQGLTIKQKVNVVCLGGPRVVLPPDLDASRDEVFLITASKATTTMHKDHQVPQLCPNALPRAKSRVNVAMRLVHEKNLGLQQKLTLMLAEPLVLHKGRKRETKEELEEKLNLLELGSNAEKVSVSVQCEKRLSAQTSWLDFATGQKFQSPWSGSCRHGASKDLISLKLREKVEYAIRQNKSRWQPNDQPDDLHDWGGPYGKPCGHNEVVMHQIRPFFPQIVLNSRLCSREHPAPGNHNFDGCLEYFQDQCRQHQKPMTVWDAYQYHYISKEGEVESIEKRYFLHQFDLTDLRRIIPTLRAHTIACHGSISTLQLTQRIEAVLKSIVLFEPRIRDKIAAFYFVDCCNSR